METVLIIEDDPTMLRGLKDNFEFKGYSVVTANDGEFEVGSYSGRLTIDHPDEPTTDTDNDGNTSTKVEKNDYIL